MINERNVTITLRNNVTGDYLVVPITPEELAYVGGDGISETVDVLNVGPVEFHTGTELDTLAWSSFFPRRYDAAYCKTTDLKTPEQYKELLDAWKNAGDALQVIIPGIGVNTTMKLVSMPVVARGFEVDFYYDILLTQYREIKPVMVTPTGGTIQSVAAAATSPENRPAVPEQPAAATYTVKTGDTLTLIAKLVGVAQWRDLYDKNKGTIGPDPNYLQVGQVLTV